MNIRIFFTLAMAANLFYGSWYFLAPQCAANIYGFGDLATPLSYSMMQFMGILFFSQGIMCGIARKAEQSTGRTAVLAFVAVSSLLCFFMDIRILLGEPGTMDYIDTVINGLFGFGALYFMLKDRKAAITV